MTTADSPAAELLRRIRHSLAEAFAPEELELTDESARHATHREGAGRCHLRLRIVAPSFTGIPPIERHRLIYQTLESELGGELHALAIVALSPEEAHR